MATFKEVFSTTWKVLLALLLISLGASVLYFIVGAISSVSRSSRSDEGDHFKDEYARGKAQYDKQADEKHTVMPESKWDKLIAAAIKQHCPVEGMTQEQAENALGKPTASDHTAGISGNGDTWQYDRTVKEECLKYSGEECAEYKVKHETAKFYFSPSGHLTYPFEGGWLSLNCYSEPFNSSYDKLLH